MTKRLRMFLFLALAFGLAACATVPKVSASQIATSRQFSGKPIDNLLLAWGPPMAQTQRNDGARILSYTYSNAYDLGTRDQRTYSCTATFVVSPDLKIIDVSMQGQDYECAVLANGYTGQKGTNTAHPTPFLRDNPPLLPF